MPAVRENTEVTSVRGLRVVRATEISMTPMTEMAIATSVPSLAFSPRKISPKKGRLSRLGTRIGGADGEVAEGEEMDEQEGRGDLRQPADDGPEEEGAVWHRQRTARHLPEQEQIKEGERQAEAEPHEGCAGRAHDAFQVFLHGRADILKECRGDGDEDPGFHGCEREQFRKSVKRSFA